MYINIAKMSFINYYPVRKEFDYELMIYCGLGVTLTILFAWYLWAVNYRYSSERIADKLLKKYAGPVSDNQAILADNGQLSPDGTKASAVITVRDKGISTSAVTQELYSLPVRSICSPIDKTCISL